jgi:hypothetical protein
MAGNQLGKTIAGGFEAAMHATGRYPRLVAGQEIRHDRRPFLPGGTREPILAGAQEFVIQRRTKERATWPQTFVP